MGILLIELETKTSHYFSDIISRAFSQQTSCYDHDVVRTSETDHLPLYQTESEAMVRSLRLLS